MSVDGVVVIGVDCATQPQRVGLARGLWLPSAETPVMVTDVVRGDAVDSLAAAIAGWIDPTRPTLLALDAPLGWPHDLGRELAEHQAGDALATPPNALFRRETDRVVKSELGKLPLDVGADRIARTAHSALALLAELRQLTNEPIPLAWSWPFEVGIAAIEVYPAGSLAARGWQSTGYKRDLGREARGALLVKLLDELELACGSAEVLANDDLFDAMLAVLAGVDFLNQTCIPPADLPLAQKEGWIWVKKPPSNAATGGVI